jgi:hypothetical protein
LPLSRQEGKTVLKRWLAIVPFALAAASAAWAQGPVAPPPHAPQVVAPPACPGCSLGARLRGWFAGSPSPKGKGEGCGDCCLRPGFWRNFCATGHRMFSMPTGHNCCGGIQ